MGPKVFKIMMVAGEASGDMHAAKVIEALLRKNKKLSVFGLGGPLMAKAGMEVRQDLTRQALIGFWEVLKHYPVIRRRFADCEKWLRDEKPDLLFLVDYPGFNLRLAGRAHRMGIPVCYYVAPKVWAWNQGRVKAMKKIIRKLLVIFPFETEFFKKHGIKAIYVGNPLMEEMNLKPVQRKETLGQYGIQLSRFPVVCAMPGSRRGEIEKIWPLFLKASRILRKICPDAAFVVPKSQGLEQEDFAGLTHDDPFFFVEGPAYELRKACDVAWIKSGTSTLETALLRTPMVVVYKVAAMTGFLAKRFLRIKNVSLVNLLAGKTVVTELLQDKAKPKKLVEETNRILDHKDFWDRQIKAFQKIKKDISKPSKPSARVAQEILKLLAEAS
jgi:lipid-A-disaccharide synthase